MIENQEKKSLDEVLGHFRSGKTEVRCSGLEGASMAYAASRLHAECRAPLLMVVASPKAADALMADLAFFTGPASPPLLYFPPYNALPFGSLTYHNDLAARRIRALYALENAEKPPILVTTVAGLLQKIVPKTILNDYSDIVMAGEDLDREGLIRKLVAGGYSRCAIVEEPGDFSVRGGVLDVFTPLYDDPLRIELFGDMVESLRFFSPTTQRTAAHAREAVILPAREAILDMAEVAPALARIRDGAHADGLPIPKIREVAARIEEEGVFPGLERLMPFLYGRMDTLFDFLPSGSRILLSGPETLRETASELWGSIKEKYAAAFEDGRVCARPDALFDTWDAAEARLEENPPLSISPLPVARGGGDRPGIHHFSVKENTDIALELKTRRGGTLAPLVDWVREKKGDGAGVVFSVAGPSGADRLRSLLEPYGVRPDLAEGFPDPRRAGGRVFICQGRVSGGFFWPDEALAVMTEAEIFGARRPVRRKGKPKVQTDLLSFADLKGGDLVVHTEHGIGRYDGLVKLTLDGFDGDFLLIRYRDEDRLYLPVDRMSAIQKYMGVEGYAPTLDKMGGKTWDKVKEKVKRSVERIAGDLLNLYAERKVREGRAFAPPDETFRAFEADFPYEETPDQRRAIEDVLSDMAADTPMDRLVCGDVGYGKTEVALRAAFMAVNDGRQVAVLVPTTVLAEQHYATFSERFQRYPARVECLSRFRSPKEQRAIVAGLKDGAVDIVVGTHRLVQKDIQFKDMGLMVLDEEQRFGVRHKEKLKQMRANVDVLALTATPIPRTLHLSMVGIRDISVISTPPEERRAIVTYICEPEDGLIADAIRRELQRSGQMFFVHNNVHGIERVASRIKDLVPEVRLDVAHGQMDEADLERVMYRFMQQEIDMLVCTTIIEAGLDVPSANTILVNRADRFGLSQIYQLRGRVGRSDEQAYAYLFIPGESTLGKNARKRLKVLMEHNDLGAGFQIAMNDLKIRGGGTILGASQSGHIAAVGYDMFLKLMENAVSEMKGEPVREDLEPEINVSMSAYLSEDYIPDIDQRLTAYRRLARMTDLKEIADYKAELTDRFGPLPPEAANLLLKILLKALSIRAGVRRLDLTDGHMQVHFSEAHQKNPFGVTGMVMERPDRYRLTPDHVLKVDLSRVKTKSPMAGAKNILKEIAQRVNN